MSLPRLISGASVRVLLVEDDDMIGDSMRKGLCRDGPIIDQVRDGETAVCAVTAPGAASAESGSTLFDLMLLGLGLSKCDGLDVAREVHQHGIAIPVLILTAYDAMANRVTGLNTGADGYLVKPSDLQELATRIHTLLRGQGDYADPPMRHGEVLLNPVTYEVLHTGVSAKLLDREFTVLHALLARPSRTRSVAQLQGDPYGWNEEADSSTVEMCIHALRKKLDSHSIRSTHGVGYVVLHEASTSPAESVDGGAHQ